MTMKAKTTKKDETPEATVARQRREIKTLKKELGNLKEAYFKLVDRLELIEDLHPQVLDTLRDHGMLDDEP